MNKSILVINMPEDFDYRRCSIGGDGNIYYEREGEQRTSIIGNIKNLKPLPEKKVGDDLYERYGSWTLGDEKEASYRVGFNDCIDEILGEK